MQTDEMPDHKFSFLKHLPQHLCPGCLLVSTAPEARCTLCGRNAFEAQPSRPGKVHWFARFISWLIKPLGWPLKLTVLLAFGLGLNSAFNNWVPFGPTIFSALIWCLVALCWLPRFLARFILMCINPQQEMQRPGWRMYLAVPALLLLQFGLAQGSVSIATLTAFAISRRSLESASRLPDSPVEPKPVRAGLFKVLAIQHSGKDVHLTVTRGGFLDTIYAGFAKCPDGCKTFSTGGVAEDNYTYLTSGWYWWHRTEYWD